MDCTSTGTGGCDYEHGAASDKDASVSDRDYEYGAAADLHWHDKETYCDGSINLLTGEIRGAVRQLDPQNPDQWQEVARGEEQK